MLDPLAAGSSSPKHGSWNRTNKIGYRVMQVRLEGGKAVSYEPFANGWLRGEEV